MNIRVGDFIETPRFLKVKIEKILTRSEAGEQGYNEPTHYRNPDFEIFGKHLGENRMNFAAIKK